MVQNNVVVGRTWWQFSSSTGTAELSFIKAFHHLVNKVQFIRKFGIPSDCKHQSAYRKRHYSAEHVTRRAFELRALRNTEVMVQNTSETLSKQAPYERLLNCEQESSFSPSQPMSTRALTLPFMIVATISPSNWFSLQPQLLGTAAGNRAHTGGWPQKVQNVCGQDKLKLGKRRRRRHRESRPRATRAE